MKQLVMLLIAGVVAFTLSACGEERPQHPQADNQTTTHPVTDQTIDQTTVPNQTNTMEPGPTQDGVEQE